VNKNNKNKIKLKVEFTNIDLSEYGFDENTEREIVDDLARAIDREIVNRIIEMGRIETIEGKIFFYDNKYKENKDSSAFIHMAENGLLNSIRFRTQKILRDYCGS